MKLVCYFDFQIEEQSKQMSVEREGGQGLLAFINGFWLDDLLEYTEDRERYRWWIPPGQIRSIYKEYGDD